MKVGDILMGKFPMAEGGALMHPMLVLHIDQSLTGQSMVVGYGSSKKVSESGSKRGEFVILESDRAFKKSGLSKSTRFDMSVKTNLPVETFAGKKIGILDLNDQAIIARLKKVMMDVMDF